MNIPKGYLEEILGISVRARHRETHETRDFFAAPIIHKQIQGEKVFIPLDPNRWQQ